MKRSPIVRKTPLKASGRVKPRRATPRRREAPRWTRDDWAHWGLFLDMRCGGRCEWCGTDAGPFERHHRKRRRDGGDRLSNILYLCRADHVWVTEHPKAARQYGLIVSVSRDPAMVPVLLRKLEWVLLTDEGGKVPAFAVNGDAHE